MRRRCLRPTIHAVLLASFVALLDNKTGTDDARLSSLWLHGEGDAFDLIGYHVHYVCRTVEVNAKQNDTNIFIFIHSYNMVAQANNTGTSKNTTNENEKKIMTVPLYTYKLKH